MKPSKILLLGTGLVGGSIGLGLRQAWPEAEIVAVDRDTQAADRAVELGVATSAGTVEDAVGCQLVVVSVPVSAGLDAFRQLAPHLAPGCVVTDVGSTKRNVVDAAAEALPLGTSFVGGHPMAGSEHSGVEYAHAELFRGNWWILTPTSETPPEAYKLVLGMAAALGARTLVLDPDIHDSLVAAVSHLPQLLASGLMRFAGEQGRDLAALRALSAGGFRDMTRIASSPASIWIDICRENRSAIGKVLHGFAQELEQVAAAVERRDEDWLKKFFEEAKEARESVPVKSGIGELVEILVDIPDRPGALAEITTLVGELGINIEDLGGITHSADGTHGVLSLFVRSDAPRDVLLVTLESRGLVVR